MANSSTFAGLWIGCSRAVVRFGQRFTQAAFALSLSDRGRSLAFGTAAGLYAVDFWHQFTVRFGAGLPTMAGALAAVAIGVLIGALTRRREMASLQSVMLLLAPAAWALMFGALGDVLLVACGRLEFTTLCEPGVQAAVGLAAAIVMLAVPAACGARLVATWRGIREASMMAGAGLGCIIAVYLLAPGFGVESAAWVAAAGSIVGAFLSALAATPEEADPASDGRLLVKRARQLPFGARVTIAIVGSVLVGVIVAALERATFQLFPATDAARWTFAAGFLLGAGAGWGLALRDRVGAVGASAGPIRTLSLGACLSVLPLVLFPALTTLFLDATSNVSLVWVLMMTRGCVAAAIAFSGGLVWGALLTLCRAVRPDLQPRPENEMQTPSLVLRVGVAAAVALLVGFLVTRAVVAARLGIPLTVSGLAVVLAIISTSMAFAAGRRDLPRAVIGGMCTAALVTLAMVWGTYDPVCAARLLFSTDVFMAHHAGTEMRLLPFLDDGRFIDRVEGAHGTYTLWKNRGDQLNLRESGIPRGAYCIRTDFCPQYSGEIVPAVLPLVLHQSPRRVLVVGIGSGSTLAACLEFPIEKVACLEEDRGLIDILERKVWPAAPNDPRGDNRLSIIKTDPVLAVHAAGGGFDVIIAQTDAPGIAMGTPYFTQEFYRGVARQLAVDGIFAQRFQQVDFGPWPLRSVLATMKSVFGEVAAVEGGPGDLVLLGTSARQGFVRPGLLARFQSPQVVRTLASIGWDWSVGLNLAAYSGQGCDALLRPWPPINTSANGLFAFRLPQETMRWGPKGEEMMTALAPHAGRIAQWPNVDGNDPELLRRLTDVVAQHKMMTSYPDQPWAYRKALREELTKNSRTVIEDADEGPERKLDRVDRHRVRYLSALGKAAQMPRPTPEALHRVEEYAEPYDPVVTYFLHHELARLYAQAQAPEPDAELGHRLYAIYYGDRADRSVRDIVDAIDLVVANPRTLAAAERWDHLNALLEFMEARWNNRGLTKPPSARIMLNDLEKSIDASERAFAEMERLSSEIGMPTDDWLARREVLERALVRPLRSYRAEVLPYYLKEVEQADAAKNGRPPASGGNAN